jgi:Zn-dependent oligopeptidase
MIIHELHLSRHFVFLLRYTDTAQHQTWFLTSCVCRPRHLQLSGGTPASIVDNTKRLIERSCKAQEQITRSVQPHTATFANVLLPLAHIENAMALEAYVFGFYKVVSTDSKLRDASSEAQKLLEDFSIETAMHENLYKLVDAVLKKNEDLDPESYQLLKKVYKDHIRNGLILPIGPERDRFKQIKGVLSSLALSFEKIRLRRMAASGLLLRSWRVYRRMFCLCWRKAKEKVWGSCE